MPTKAIAYFGSCEEKDRFLESFRAEMVAQALAGELRIFKEIPPGADLRILRAAPVA